MNHRPGKVGSQWRNRHVSSWCFFSFLNNILGWHTTRCHEMMFEIVQRQRKVWKKHNQIIDWLMRYAPQRWTFRPSYDNHLSWFFNAQRLTLAYLVFHVSHQRAEPGFIRTIRVAQHSALQEVLLLRLLLQGHEELSGIIRFLCTQTTSTSAKYYNSSPIGWTPILLGWKFPTPTLWNGKTPIRHMLGIKQFDSSYFMLWFSDKAHAFEFSLTVSRTH